VEKYGCVAVGSGPTWAAPSTPVKEQSRNKIIEKKIIFNKFMQRNFA
jgi:hypothetical protein